MLVQTAHINGMTRDQYDALLASGWFRGTGIIYRSEIVCIDEQIYSVQNIRLPLGDFSPVKKHRKLLRRNNQEFRMVIGKPSVDERKEKLYAGHLKRFKAFVHVSLDEIINNGTMDCGFETKELSVYHGSKLVAVSYFDVSKTSLASIMCLYDQEYSAFSLGVYTMLLEIEYARLRGVAYYYPGYVLDRPSSFDYKLSLGPCEWMADDRRWYAKPVLPAFQTKGDIYREKMAELKLKLTLRGYIPKFRLYPYFTVGQVMREHPSLLRLPCYFTFYRDGMLMAASYDHEEDSFMTFSLHVAEDLEFTQHLELSDDYRNSSVYELQIMKCGFYVPLSNLPSADSRKAMKYSADESL